jgi:glycosyltransferase involved in cell wall biosynthesis
MRQVKNKLMKLILSHPTANANVRAVAYGFNDAAMLAAFYTAVASFPGDLMDKMSSLPPLAEISRRQFKVEIQGKTKSYPWFELGRLLASKLKLKGLTRHETGSLSVDAVYHRHDQWVASKLKSYTKINEQIALYAYEDGAKYSFIKAKELNIPCYYDLPIGYWRTARDLLKNEINKWPDWAPTLTGFKDSDVKLLRKDEELQLADRIFVASSFTAKTLLSFPGKLAPVTVVPYGFPQVGPTKKYSQSGPLKVLFVGGLSQRKGIANLFEAVAILGKSVELTVVGRKSTSDCPALDEALAKHKWIPSLPHAEVLKLMQTQDVLVFPSLFEGFGLVITEAMSQGIPVITTDRTVGPDIIENGRNGWLVEAGSTEALVIAIENLIIHRHLIANAGNEAMLTAASRPWEVYGAELAEAIIKDNIKS